MLTKFNVYHCHKWAFLLKDRKRKIDSATEAIASGDIETAKRLTDEVFHGTKGRHSEPGMEGSLLYHMAMVTKMAAEYGVILEELKANAPDLEGLLGRFYRDFVSDAKEILDEVAQLNENVIMGVKKPVLGVEESLRFLEI